MLVNVLRKHALVRGLQSAGCIVLAELAQSNKESHDRIRDCAGIPLVLGALENHPYAGDVQEHGCRALYCLARHDAFNLHIVCAGKGIELIVLAMKNHPRNGGVRCAACLVISQLAMDSKPTQDLFRSHGAIPLVLNTLVDSRPSNQQYSLLAVVSLADVNDDGFADLGAIELILNKMRQHPTERMVQWYGYDALGALLSKKKKQHMERFQKSHGVETVQKAVNGHTFPRNARTDRVLGAAKRGPFIKSR
mmetsp:Transcript_9450/g.15806  ORF Transcript_9450/g.15806 Transcript_9450/m.15806 type:complete len:250 (+) Transcript_9450:3-752(+)